MIPTPIALRERVVDARVEDGQSMGEISKRLKLPKATVQNILRRYKESGSIEPKPQNAGRKSAFSKEDLKYLEEDVLCHPDATLEELRAHSDVKVSIVSFHNALKKMGFTLKKNRYLRLNSNGPKL